MRRSRSTGGLYLESTRAEQLGVLPGEDRPVCEVMSRRVITVDPAVPVRVAADLMRREAVPALVVKGADRFEGLVTERDMAVAHAAGEDQESNRAAIVRDLIETAHRGPVVCREEDIVADALSRMKLHRLSAMPVLDGHGSVIGLLSLLDVAASLAPEAAPAWLNEVRK